LRNPAPTKPAFALLVLGLSGLLAGWVGCSAAGSNSITTSNSAGVGGSIGVGVSVGGAGGTGGSGSGTGAGKTDGGKPDAGDAGKDCTASEKMCDGKCVAADDPSYGCSATFCTTCPTYANAASACSMGMCALGTCETGFKNCDGNDANGCETNTGTDPNNCGACGAPCVIPHATPACTAGMCGVGTCDMGFTDCNGDPTDGCEANLQNDPMNCGMCAKACAGQQECQAGMCGLVCAKGTANCPGDPADVCATNLGTNKNCAFCGDTCALPNSNSQCTMMGNMEVCDLNSCNPGYQNCDMIAANGCETNTTTDANNCDSCGNVCPSGPHSTPVCNGSVCAIVCDPGFLDCDKDPTNGCEVNGNSDLGNCGTCGDACITPNATPSCTSGQCAIAVCNTGYADCDTKVPDGCEVNIQSDPNNCGTCGDICSTPHATPACTNQVCSIGACAPGYLDCDGKVSDGCEINGGADVTNCGTCGNVCAVANGSPTCTGGACAILSCNPGFQDCDHKATDGCEVNTNTNTANCGSCGSPCITPNATPSCANGMCGIASCNPGFANCDGSVTDGCEINTLNDANNCGGCGMKCNLPNAVAACTNGMCTVAVCSPGFTDCDGSPTNGCETNTAGDANNCGSCNAKCELMNATAGCSGGMCTVATCASGYQDCNHLPGDGCEVHTAGDPDNCGGCGLVCNTPNAAPGCFASACTVASCNPGFANCDGIVSNGCEINTTNDNSNCGACNNACLAACGGSADHVTATQCNASKCDIIACAGGYQDFDGTCTNGCECVDSTTQATCPAATSLFAGPLSIGGSINPFSSSMAPLTVTQAYFTLTFENDTSNPNPSYHPHITLTSTVVAGQPEFLMDVTQDCSGTLVEDVVCSDNGANNSRGVIGWESFFPTNAQKPAQNPMPGMDYYNPIPAVGTNGQVWIRVYRNALFTTPTCNPYTITASD
jgi:hypothetical protein